MLCALSRHATELSSKPAIIIGDETINYATLWLNALKAAKWLAWKGVEKGEYISLSAIKDKHFFYLYIGAQIIGATSIIIDSSSNAGRLNYIEKVTSPKLALGYCSNIIESYHYEDIDFNVQWSSNNRYTVSATPNDIAEILFTTGTTGTPKGVCLSFANIDGSVANINGFIGNTSTDIEVLALPICHSFGLGRMRCNLTLGSTVIVVENFANVRKLFSVIEQYHVTGMGIVPSAWAYIRKISGRRIARYAEQIRYIEIGSASMSHSSKMELLELFPAARICMHYGLTEASRICFQEFHDTAHIDSIGCPASRQVDVQIIDEDGKLMSCLEEGEICVKGNMVTMGYLNKDDNNSAYHGEYFRTGDLGCVDADGYFYLSGRIKEMINVGGKNVSPAEVEEAVCSVGVGDCICVPITDSTGVLGELVKCYILRGSTTLSFEQIATAVGDLLETYKRPVIYDWIEKIPTTASGKKQRIGLK